MQSSGLVIEAIVENLEVKQKLFSALDKVAPKYTYYLYRINILGLFIQLHGKFPKHLRIVMYIIDILLLYTKYSIYLQRNAIHQ